MGVLPRRVERPSYAKPYPACVDTIPYPPGYRIPSFTLFSGDAYQSTIEHIGRFTAQCGEASSDDNKLRLFVHSLTGPAFTWFINLPPNSINTWREMERAFHDQYYRAQQEIRLADLAKTSQMSHETPQEYLSRFKLARARCLVRLPESEFVDMAVV